MVWARAMCANIIAENNRILEDYESAALRWDTAADLSEAIGNKEYAARARANAAVARAVRANIIAENDKTPENPENYENEALCWETVAVLFEAIGNKEYAARARENVAWARAKAAWERANQARIIAENYETPENYKNEALRWDTAAVLFEAIIGNKEYAAEARVHAARARVNQARIIEENELFTLMVNCVISNITNTSY